MSKIGSITHLKLADSSSDGDQFVNPKSAPKLDYDECYYDILEVDPDVDPKSLKKGYYKVVSIYHPDNKPDLTEEDTKLCNLQMMVINCAYRILKDPLTRKDYDSKRALGLYGAQARIKGSGTNDSRYRKKKVAPRRPSSRPTPPPPLDPQAQGQGQERRYTPEDEREKERESRYTGSPPPKKKRRMSPTAARFLENESDAKTAQDDVRSTVSSNYQDAEAYFNSDQSYNDLDDETRRYAAGRMGNAAHPGKRPGARPYSSTARDEDGFEIITSRGDGSVRSLKAYLASLITQKAKLESKLLADNRDWGEETNMESVKQRLRDIEVLKKMAVTVGDLEDEIENLTYYTSGSAYEPGDRAYRSSYSSYRSKIRDDSGTDRDRYDGFDTGRNGRDEYNPFNESQPQVDPRWPRDRDSEDPPRRWKTTVRPPRQEAKIRQDGGVRVGKEWELGGSAEGW